MDDIAGAVAPDNTTPSPPPSATDPETFNAVYGLPQTTPQANDEMLNQAGNSFNNTPGTPLPAQPMGSTPNQVGSMFGGQAAPKPVSSFDTDISGYSNLMDKQLAAVAPAAAPAASTSLAVSGPNRMAPGNTGLSAGPAAPVPGFPTTAAAASPASNAYSKIKQLLPPPPSPSYGAVFGNPAQPQPMQAPTPMPALPTVNVAAAPALPMAPSSQAPALPMVAGANTSINPFSAQLSQQPTSTISDRRAKTNIKSARRDVNSFLNYLGKGK